MASGTINIITGHSMWDCRLVWSSTANYSSNSSTLSCNYQVYYKNPSAGMVSSFWGYCSWSYTEGGAAQNEHFFPDITKGISPNEWVTLTSWTWTIPHSTSGTRSIYLWGDITNEQFDTTAAPLGGLSKWITLDTIPRAAQITSAPNFTDEDNPVITYTNPSGSRVSKLELFIYDGDGTNTVLVNRELSTSQTQATITLTNSERELIRQRTISKGVKELTVRYYIKTTINSNVYTSNQVAKMCYIKDPEPELHYSWWDADTGVTPLTNNNEIFIKGYSNLDFSLEATPKKGASITQYAVTWVYTKTSTVPMIGGSGTHDPFWNITTDKVKFSATDNRGVTKTEEQLLYMVDYFPPTCSITASNIELDEESGTTASCDIEISGEFFNDKFGPNGVQNELKIEILYTGVEDWFELPDILWGDGVNGNTFKANFTANGLDYRKPATFQIRVSDKLVSGVLSEPKTLNLYPIFDWDDNDFNFNIPVSFQGDKMEDMVVKTGTNSMGSNGTWYWVKYKSGRSECWGYRNFGNMAVNTAWGSLYQSAVFHQSLPSSLFAEPPNYIGIDFYSNDSTSYGWVSRGGNKPTATDTGQFVLLRATSATLSAGTFCFHCIGRWKVEEGV